MPGQPVQPQLSYGLGLAMRGPAEMTLREILAGYGWEEDVLSGALRLVDVLTAFGLEAIPPIGVGGLDDRRVVRVTQQNDALGLAMLEIAGGECATVEFKSTLLLSVNDWKKDPQPPLQDCRSDKVIKSAVKTVAAYLNTAGGTLLVGIADGGDWFGLEEDMILADANKSDFDGWELECRKQIDKAFSNKSVNSYVSIDKIESGGKTAARIKIGRRGELSFLNVGAGPELYIRSGNRSIPVAFPDVESYFEMKRLYA